MFKTLRIKLGTFLNGLFIKAHKIDDAPETIIADIVNSFQNQIDSLKDAQEALIDRHDNNEMMIQQIEAENEDIDNSIRSADKLKVGLMSLVGG